MYAGRVASYPLVSHVEYDPRSIKVEKDVTDGRTDGQTDALLLPLYAVSVIISALVPERSTVAFGTVKKGHGRIPTRPVLSLRNSTR